MLQKWAIHKKAFYLFFFILTSLANNIEQMMDANILA